ncbi:MAG: GNAT family N-acetyltransferase, partial [Candidatus Humimicrobiaceae bacterium]
IRFLGQLTKEKALSAISLTVNKNNSNAIKAYEKLGFKNMGSVVKDIGHGFIMDDYKMEKKV